MRLGPVRAIDIEGISRPDPFDAQGNNVGGEGLVELRRIEIESACPYLAWGLGFYT